MTGVQTCALPISPSTLSALSDSTSSHRLLAHSGIDPRYALDFWEDRLEAPPATSSAPPAPSSHLLRLHSANAAAPSAAGLDSHGPDGACGFLSTHPVNADRIARLRAELDKWLRYAASSTLA